jgi:hypothetical protein
MSFSGTKGYITKPKPGVMINPLHPLSRGLVGYWLFNEGTGSLANDISGYGNHGVLKNMSPNVQGGGWAGSRIGGGLSCDGNDDYVNIGDIGAYFTNQITIVCTITALSTLSAYDRVISNYDGTDYSLIMSVDSNTSNGYRLAVHNGSTGVSAKMGSTIPIGEQLNVVGTYDNSKVKIYVDGIIKDDAAQTGDLRNVSNEVWFGSDPHSYNPANILFDHVSIYNRVLSAVEVKQFHHNPFCNLMQVPIRRYSVAAAPPVGAIMNQFQRANIGADLYNGVLA